jgi:arabinofuranosyltransferase
MLNWNERRTDLFAALLLIVVVVVYGAVFVDFKVPPFEDAAMLMRYADHLAHGHGVVWNIGEHPVDGATDFLFMAATAALIDAGLAIGRSIRFLGYASHLLTVLLVYWVNRKLWKANVALSALAALYLAVGTGLWYVAAFFGTPFFALFAATTWALGLVIVQRDAPASWLSVLFAVSALLTGLVRPEGAALGVFMLLAVVLMKGWRGSARTVVIFVLVMLVLGGAYFLWHWSYFGYPLPNPFYKKGGGLLHWDSFWESLGNLIRFGGPFLIAFVLGFRSTKTVRQTTAFLLPLVLFAAVFILVSNETNYGGRFQYALWPLILLSFYPLIRGLAAEVGFSWPRPAPILPRVIWMVVAGLVAYGFMRYAAAQSCSLTSAQQTCGVAFEADGRYEAAQSLAAFQNKGYVLATTEAGLLPLYSGWRSVDAWGLNDAWIAHHGEITPEYLDQYKPNLIVFHAYFSPLVPPRINDKNLSQDWFRMTLTLKTYAESHNYVLAAAFGDSPYEAHYYYVRPDFPDSERIVRSIAAMRNYYWFATGKKAINYANLQP